MALVANTTWNFYNFRRGLVSALITQGYRVLLFAPSGPHLPELAATGARFIPVENLSRSGQKPLEDLALVRELLRLFRKESVDLCLLYTIKPVIYGSIAARLAGLKSVVTMTGLGYTFIHRGFTSRMVQQLYRLALRKVDKVLFHNPDDLALFVGKGFTKTSVAEVVPGSGLPLGEYPLAPYTEAVPGRFLYVGRLVIDKGIREFMQAAEIAYARNPELSFEVAGALDPENPASISPAEFEQFLAAGPVKHFGAVEDIRPYLRKAAVVVLPSHREGCPRALLEAAATGRALIGTDVPGVRYVVREKENGYLTELKNQSQLANLFLRIGTETGALQKMGERGREIVGKEFSEKRVVGQYLRIVEGLV